MIARAQYLYFRVTRASVLSDKLAAGLAEAASPASSPARPSESTAENTNSSDQVY